MGLLEIAASALVGAERRTDIAARNIANAQTPGYKREVAYSEISGAGAVDGTGRAEMPVTGSILWLADGTLTDTGNPLDIAVRGDGYLLLRDGERFFLSRGGQFRRDADGALVDANGRIAQQAGGGDLVVDVADPEILPDGTVLVADTPVATLGLYAAASDLVAGARGGMEQAQALSLGESSSGELRQGMLERSNVVLSDEMVGLMRNQRLAESGAQLVRAYDELLGQAVATFGRKN